MWRVSPAKLIVEFQILNFKDASNFHHVVIYCLLNFQLKINDESYKSETLRSMDLDLAKSDKLIIRDKSKLKSRLIKDIHI